MIHVVDNKDCCGCGACVNMCNHKCITMQEDSEGFLYPSVDYLKCVNCGLCEKVCPMANVPQDNSVQRVYAVKNKNESVRSVSSSGGVFFLLAEYVLDQGGVVVGCRLDDNMVAKHVVAHNKQELLALLSSKYVQSETHDIYNQVKALLKQGVQVLFSGTPCQVAALRNFLGKVNQNLICVDILCHGVPSPKIFREYKKRLEDRYRGKIVKMNFRDKQKNWKRLFISAIFANEKHFFLYSGYDSFMQLFLADSLQRPSCFHCPYNTINRPGDVTLGDFWGIGRLHPEKDDDKGISLVLINNDYGKKIWGEIKDKTDYFESTLDAAISGNKVLIQHLPTDKARNEFYNDYVEHGYDIAVAKHAPEASKPYQWYYNFMRWGLDLVRKIKHESY